MTDATVPSTPAPPGAPRVIQMFETGLFLLSAVAAGLFILLLPLDGVHFVQSFVLPGLLRAAALAAAGALILSPLLWMKRPSPLLQWYFMPASIILAFTAWTQGLVLTAHFAGDVGLVMGLCAAIVGVVPVGIVAAALSARYDEALFCLLLALSAVGARALIDRTLPAASKVPAAVEIDPAA